QSGKVRSKGFEFEASGPLPYDFNVKLALSTQKVRVVEDADPARVGSKLFGVGKGNATAFLEWAPTAGPLAGFGIGGDVRYVDRTYGTQGLFTTAFRQEGYEVPSYTVFDASLRYDLGRAVSSLHGVTLQVNATNLLDKKYLTSCYLDYSAWCWYGNRRTVQGTIAYRW
ncbi:MAG: TonB-dependent receptor, partial [Sphingomonas sp.]